METQPLARLSTAALVLIGGSIAFPLGLWTGLCGVELRTVEQSEAALPLARCVNHEAVLGGAESCRRKRPTVAKTDRQADERDALKLLLDSDLNTEL